ncbi:MAG: hypothetical protein Q8O32_02785 [bacterium]|nr:hypothetical protein [bacterium]
MDIHELRNIIINYPKFPGTQTVSRASVCNDGFPGTFNLSYSEAEMIEHFGQYLDYDKDLIYSKIQPVIRFQDWEHIAIADEHSYRYLSVFDLADIGGSIVLKQNKNWQKTVQISIDSLAKFLFDVILLDKTKIRISYFQGGDVSQVTKEKYKLNFKLPTDETREFWKQHGIQEKQFIPDESRDTLLALNVFGLPTPWGFRHEINYLHNGKLLDIATFEYLFYRPIFNNNTLVGLRRWEHLFVISAVGLERLLMVINNFHHITECSHIRPLVESILNVATEKKESEAEILTQALRAIHLIITDCDSYTNLSPRRKEKLRSFLKAVISSHNKLGISLSKTNLEKWFKLNTELQPFYPELKKSVKRTVREVAEAQKRLQTDKSMKHGGVAQK